MEKDLVHFLSNFFDYVLTLNSVRLTADQRHNFKTSLSYNSHKLVLILIFYPYIVYKSFEMMIPLSHFKLLTLTGRRVKAICISFNQRSIDFINYFCSSYDLSLSNITTLGDMLHSALFIRT